MIGGRSAAAGLKSRPSNALLRLLNDADFDLLAPHLEHGEIPSGATFYNTADDVDYSYFPCGTGIVSLIVGAEEGREIRALMVGQEGAVGGVISGGLLPTHSRVVVTTGGHFAKISISELEKAKARSRALRRLFALCGDHLLSQALQSIACNALHSIEERAAKFILRLPIGLALTRCP